MEALVQGARQLGLELTPEQVRAFAYYQQALLEWNARFNLTAITTPLGIQVKHFLDSLSCLRAFPPELWHSGWRVVDVGTGAGFPGLPLKLVCPELRLTLVEATLKKTFFLRAMVDELGLEGVTVLHARAEELGQDAAHREQYDGVLARAVAEMPVLAEYTLPLARVGGWVLAQKGDHAAQETQSALGAVRLLGGRLRALLPVSLPELESRYLVVLDKVAPTPAKYPRRVGMPTKRPLRVEDEEVKVESDETA